MIPMAYKNSKRNLGFCMKARYSLDFEEKTKHPVFGGFQDIFLVIKNINNLIN